MPVISGISADLAYSPGEQASSNSAGRQFGGSIGYAAGPLNVRLAYNNKNSDVAAAPGEDPDYGRRTLAHLSVSSLTKVDGIYACSFI